MRLTVLQLSLDEHTTLHRNHSACDPTGSAGREVHTNSWKRRKNGKNELKSESLLATFSCFSLVSSNLIPLLFFFNPSPILLFLLHPLPLCSSKSLSLFPLCCNDHNCVIMSPGAVPAMSAGVPILPRGMEFKIISLYVFKVCAIILVSNPPVSLKNKPQT